MHGRGKEESLTPCAARHIRRRTAARNSLSQRERAGVREGALNCQKAELGSDTPGKAEASPSPSIPLPLGEGSRSLVRAEKNAPCGFLVSGSTPPGLWRFWRRVSPGCTRSYSRGIPPGCGWRVTRSTLECGGRAQRRRRFRVAGVGRQESGVALRFPPQSKSVRVTANATNMPVVADVSPRRLKEKCAD